MSEEKLNEELSKEELVYLLKLREHTIKILNADLRKKETTLQTITGIIVSIVVSVITLSLIRIFS
ncbi:hypothetical protein R6Z02_16660 [Carnobacterium maltaromaticum]|uniref:hypothetical protein n=1 Tax=Carnobacterium maltaromaticum TaxID=2751 RepID=UPI00298A872A|nr:hypothetical protein [Carnobacterium maltaromaticum]MDW5525368.1 hypothetical protein [Carnobacterium maltaromaticum]